MAPTGHRGPLANSVVDVPASPNSASAACLPLSWRGALNHSLQSAHHRPQCIALAPQSLHRFRMPVRRDLSLLVQLSVPGLRGGPHLPQPNPDKARLSRTDKECGQHTANTRPSLDNRCRLRCHDNPFPPVTPYPQNQPRKPAPEIKPNNTEQLSRSLRSRFRTPPGTPKTTAYPPRTAQEALRAKTQSRSNPNQKPRPLARARRLARRKRRARNKKRITRCNTHSQVRISRCTTWCTARAVRPTFRPICRILCPASHR